MAAPAITQGADDDDYTIGTTPGQTGSDNGSEDTAQEGGFDEEDDENEFELCLPRRLANKDWVIPFSAAMVVKKVEDDFDCDGVSNPMTKKVTFTLLLRFKCTMLKNKKLVMEHIEHQMRVRVN